MGSDGWYSPNIHIISIDYVRAGLQPYELEYGGSRIMLFWGPSACTVPMGAGNRQQGMPLDLINDLLLLAWAALPEVTTYQPKTCLRHTRLRAKIWAQGLFQAGSKQQNGRCMIHSHGHVLQ